jgi:transcriptional regulator with XRE-family HTH domain
MNIDKNSDDYCYYIVRSNIKKYRQKAGITAQELADRSGLSHQFIRSLEALKIVKRPRLDSLARIAKALDINLKQLFDEVE